MSGWAHRPVRRASGVRNRLILFGRRVGRLCPRAEPGGAHRQQRGWCRASAATLMVPVGRLAVLRATPKTDLGQGDRLPHLARAARARARSRRRRRARAVRVVAVDLRGQRAAGARRARAWPGASCRTCACEAAPPLDRLGFGLAAARRRRADGRASKNSARARSTCRGRRRCSWRPPLLVAAVVHLLRAPKKLGPAARPAHPRDPTTGSPLRAARSTAMVIIAIPFLLPLLFQLGFGWSPAQAGLVVIALFVGNVGIKPADDPAHAPRSGLRGVLARRDPGVDGLPARDRRVTRRRRRYRCCSPYSCSAGCSARSASRPTTASPSPTSSPTG